MIIITISVYPLFSIDGYIGVVIWICLFAITLYTTSKIEKFKKNHDIQTYKEILAFIVCLIVIFVFQHLSNLKKEAEVWNGGLL